MTTNLLPPKARIELYQDEVKKLIIILGILILLFLLSLSLILFAIKDYISRQVESERILVYLEKKQLETSGIQNLREKIILTNQNLSQLISFYQEQVRLTEIFNKISDILPSQMYLTNFSYQKESAQISLAGFSPTQEILLYFKNDLKKEFSEVSFPTQNWMETTDIDFQFNFKITK